LLALLEAINVLIKFAQGRDFVCDFVATIKVCRIDLFMMYFNPWTSYQHEHFQVFCDVMDNSFVTITQDLVIDLNNNMGAVTNQRTKIGVKL
jgi:hypothetical protein